MFLPAAPVSWLKCAFHNFLLSFVFSTEKGDGTNFAPSIQLHRSGPAEGPHTPESPRLLLQAYPLHPLPLMAGVTRITTKNFQKLSEFSQVVQRLQGAFLTGIP